MAYGTPNHVHWYWYYTLWVLRQCTWCVYGNLVDGALWMIINFIIGPIGRQVSGQHGNNSMHGQGHRLSSRRRCSIEGAAVSCCNQSGGLGIIVVGYAMLCCRCRAIRWLNPLSSVRCGRVCGVRGSDWNASFPVSLLLIMISHIARCGATGTAAELLLLL